MWCEPKWFCFGHLLLLLLYIQWVCSRFCLVPFSTECIDKFLKCIFFLFFFVLVCLMMMMMMMTHHTGQWFGLISIYLSLFQWVNIILVGIERRLIAMDIAYATYNIWNQNQFYFLDRKTMTSFFAIYSFRFHFHFFSSPSLSFSLYRIENDFYHNLWILPSVMCHVPCIRCVHFSAYTQCNLP